MTPNPLTQGDIECVAFAASAALEPCIEAAREVAAALAARRLAPRDAAALVRGLGTAELMIELHAGGEALPLLFALAGTVGHADVGAAWAGLAEAPGELLGAGLGRCAVAWPDPGGAARGHVVWLALAEGEPMPPLVWPAATLRALHGPQSPAPADAGRPLLGLPLSRVHRLTAGALPTPAVSAPRPLSATAWTDYLNAQAALVLGLIDGASRRLVQEAYAYAKQRLSAGKPIAQHQAVALRLADLALHQQALALYAQAAVEQGADVDCAAGPLQANAEHVAELCFRIGRDAVQVAAAHGYVEGLPFRRLFEQLRTLASVFASIRACPVAGAVQPAGTALTVH